MYAMATITDCLCFVSAVSAKPAWWPWPPGRQWRHSCIYYKACDVVDVAARLTSTPQGLQQESGCCRLHADGWCAV